jgi:anti-sigma factor RsiW
MTPPNARRQDLLAQLARSAQTPRQAPAPTFAPPAKRPSCPSPVLLESYARGRLPEFSAEKVRAHISRCPACGGTVSEIRTFAVRVAQAAPPPRPRQVLGAAQIAGLAVCGMLLLLANTALMDVLAQASSESPAIGVVAPAPAPATRPAAKPAQAGEPKDAAKQHAAPAEKTEPPTDSPRPAPSATRT